MGKIFLLTLLVLAGCDGSIRVTQEQANELAQSKADVEASRSTSDAAARSALLQAAGARLMAGLANVDLPAPKTPAAAMVQQDGTPIIPMIEQESRAAHEAEKDPPVGFWGMVAAGAGGVGLLALSILRFSPGAFGVVADLAHTYLAPKATKQMRAAQQEATAIAQQAVAYGHAVTQVAEAAGLKPSIEAVKTQFSEQQDRIGIKDQVDTILAAFKAGKLPVKPS